MTKEHFKHTTTVFLLAISCLVVACSDYYPERAKKSVRVSQPFIDMYKESDANSDIFYVVEHDEMIKVIGEGNQFYKIETSDGMQGWITEHEILQTTSLQGRPIKKIKHGILYF